MEALLSLAALLAGVGSGVLHLETITSMQRDRDWQLWEERLHWGVSGLAIVQGETALVAFTAPLSIYFLAR